jgi:c-di-GMP-binding flagellar brake protein YcgR
MFKQAVALWNRLLTPGQHTPRPKLMLQADPRDEERRVWVRYPSRSDAQVTPAGDEDASQVNGKVLDVSRGGAKLLVDRGFAEGSLVSLDLPGTDGPSGGSVLACVVRAEQQADDVWVLGCNFSRELDAIDLQSFGIAKAKPGEPDQRGYSRFESNFKVYYTETNAEGAARLEARVANISASGIALVVDREVPNGTMLGLDLYTAGGDLVTSILACVVHINVLPESDRVLGCNFIRELSEKELNTLLFAPVPSVEVTVP